MATTPIYGLPYQTPTDPPNGPVLGEELAEATEAALTQVASRLDSRVRTGAASWSTSASSTSGVITVNFSPSFAAPPSFVTQVVSGSGGAIRATVLVTEVTATRAQFRVDLNAAATASGSLHWIAVGP